MEVSINKAIADVARHIEKSDVVSALLADESGAYTYDGANKRVCFDDNRSDLHILNQHILDILCELDFTTTHERECDKITRVFHEWLFIINPRAYIYSPNTMRIFEIIRTIAYRDKRIDVVNALMSGDYTGQFVIATKDHDVGIEYVEDGVVIFISNAEITTRIDNFFK